MRSWLFVPGDSEKKLAKSLGSGADAVIIDLEDSVAPDNKGNARKITAAFLQDAKDDGPTFWVRVNALDTGLTDDDLKAVMDARPAGIMLPKTLSGADVTHLDAKLTVLEALNNIEDGTTLISAVATETAASLFTLGTYQGASKRLSALTWGAEDLSADLGAQTSRNDDGGLTDPYRLARVLCLAGAVTAETQPLDTVFVNFRDDEGLKAECDAACRDGFTGKMAIHPNQIDIINQAFTPSEAAVQRATEIVATFENSGNAGVVSINGEMLDRPHLLRAEKILSRAKLAGRD
ncbi:MAG: CoA ester lyase [Rhizobiales bacterium]|nr:CoA ester lyase [Hyphomicrobiales bacterium]